MCFSVPWTYTRIYTRYRDIHVHPSVWVHHLAMETRKTATEAVQHALGDSIALALHALGVPVLSERPFSM